METEARLTDVEKQLGALRTHIDDSVVKIEQSRIHNLQQIESETTKLNQIAAQAEARLQDLYGKTETHLTALMARVAKLEDICLENNPIILKILRVRPITDLSHR